jgi:epoxyqueuosine reductase
VTKEFYRQFVKEMSSELGFDYCGIATAKKLDEDARRLESWLGKGFHAGMQYMENHFDMRVDPSLLVPGAKSVITLLVNYYPKNFQRSDSLRVSKYAYGEDYHEVIREKLKIFLQRLRDKVGEINGRGFIDSAPVLERAWAVRSGLGWVGKNGNLLTKRHGSFFFIATLITDLEIAPDDPFAKDYCGSCRKCIDACPTEAILENKVVDGSKCISYHTIELKELIISPELNGKFEGWMFGCDTCQDVCPWNRFSTATNEERFEPIPEILNFSTQDWEQLTEEAFRKIFRNSPLKRSKFKGIHRNITFLQHR